MEKAEYEEKLEKAKAKKMILVLVVQRSNSILVCLRDASAQIVAVPYAEIQVADPTCSSILLQYTDTGTTSPCADRTTPGAWQGCHWSVLVA